MNLSLLLLLLFSFFKPITADYEFDCGTSSLDGCQCANAEVPSLTCDGISNMSSTDPWYKLFISGLGSDYVPGVVAFTNVAQIIFNSVNMADFEWMESHFKVAGANLNSLVFNNAQLKAMPVEPFSAGNCPKLRNLVMYRNQLDSLRKGDFNGLATLEALRIKFSGIGSIEDKTFEGLNSLESLELDGNALTMLRREMFEGLDSVTFLSISSNELTAITADTFTAMPSLKKLVLERNGIEVFAPSAIYGLTDLIYIDLSLNSLDTFVPPETFRLDNGNATIKLKSNALNCSCDMAWVDSYNGSIEGKCIEPAHMSGSSIEQMADNIVAECNRTPTPLPLTNPPKTGNSIRFTTILLLLFVFLFGFIIMQ